ncbi:hypothetical protein RchiOBHm_Chr2g0167611 [Rosa chinensis]|uniref:Uncharacterized protein n=1 Tax=Rosa chinensis TaxID=74649 RepID=A0A2P6S4E5_ROSCH|nr:hypothetical protein RchiOBHm_Chr2g0167611 [Rosa chinensis]
MFGFAGSLPKLLVIPVTRLGSSSKKAKNQSKKEAKEDNNSAFLEETRAHEIVFKPLSSGIVQELAKKSLMM